jgi:hypothetical protein
LKKDVAKGLKDPLGAWAMSGGLGDLYPYAASLQHKRVIEIVWPDETKYVPTVIGEDTFDANNPVRVLYNGRSHYKGTSGTQIRSNQIRPFLLGSVLCACY